MDKWWVRIIGTKVAFAAVALVGVFGIAIAAGAITSEPVPSTDTPTSTSAPAGDTTTTTTTTTTPEPSSSSSTPPVSTQTSPPGCVSHGEKVSTVAHDTPPGPGHGTAVSAAAQSHDGECAHDTTSDDADAASTLNGAAAGPGNSARHGHAHG